MIEFKVWHVFVVALVVFTVIFGAVRLALNNKSSRWHTFKQMHHCRLQRTNDVERLNTYTCDDGVDHVVSMFTDEED